MATQQAGTTLPRELGDKGLALLPEHDPRLNRAKYRARIGLRIVRSRKSSYMARVSAAGQEVNKGAK